MTRSITLRPQQGPPTPRIAESPAGITWATGIQNPGIEAFIKEELPRYVRSGAAVIVSIAGGSLEEFVRLTSVLQGRPEVSAIEVELSEPDEELDDSSSAPMRIEQAEIVGAVARMSMIPVFAKIRVLPAPPGSGQGDQMHVGSVEQIADRDELRAASDQRRQWLGHSEVRSYGSRGSHGRGSTVFRIQVLRHQSA